MTELDCLYNRINRLRHKMELLAHHKGSLTDPEILAMSQKIDVLVNLYLKLKKSHTMEDVEESESTECV